MAKKKSKWKKIAKNVGKAAVLAGALYGASKLGKRGLKGANVEGARGANLRGILKAKMPGNLSPDTGSGRDSSKYYHPEIWTGAKAGGRIGAKGGGIAKRGMGAAFKKGGRVKSMGIAKRGGGAAKR